MTLCGAVTAAPAKLGSASASRATAAATSAVVRRRVKPGARPWGARGTARATAALPSAEVVPCTYVPPWIPPSAGPTPALQIHLVAAILPGSGCRCEPGIGPAAMGRWSAPGCLNAQRRDAGHRGGRAVAGGGRAAGLAYSIDMTAAPVTAAADADEPLGREVWIVAAVVTVGVIMSILDTTIVNVALETLSRQLDASLNTIQWVSTGYMLALAVVIPLTGWMSERFGAKRVWMVCVGLFGLGSALCGLAWSAESLIVFRILQGFGGGMIMPVGMSVLAQTAGPHRLGRGMAVLGGPARLRPVFGTGLGGAWCRDAG